METIRLLFFTTLWTAIWATPLPKLSRRVELVAGLIPFTAFGLRVFGSCFIGVPADDPVRLASIGNISRRWRLATIWVMPAVALASLALARF